MATAAIYTRISYDPTGQGLGVERQAADCRQLCEARGWKVGEVLVDNDISAFSGRARPAYRRLLEGIEAGTFDTAVVWHPDRLHRSPVELEQFIDIIERSKCRVISVTAGDFDLGSPEGRLTARIVGSVARKEVEDKSRRVKRKHVELAELGKVSGGGRRPFGYDVDKRTLRVDEAAEIAAAASRVLAGESLRGIAADWTARGIHTVTGAPWSVTTIKRLLMSARISGQREHNGRIVGPAEWPAIIEPDDTLRLRAVLTDASRATGNGITARTYLLTGWLVCGKCGATMTTRPVRRKGHSYRRYACSVDRGGCNSVGIGAEPLEQLITEAMFQVLSSPEVGEAMQRQTRAPMVDTATVEAIEARLLELAEMFAAGDINKAEWSTAKEGLDRRLVAAQAELAGSTITTTVVPYLGQEEVLRREWPTMTIDRRRAVISRVVDNIVIAPTSRANNKFDPARVTVAWKA